MLTGKEILIAGAACIITIAVIWFVIKWLISAALDYLRETLIELKNNDLNNGEKITVVEKCNIGMKRDIQHNSDDIDIIFTEFRKCKEDHKKV